MIKHGQQLNSNENATETATKIALETADPSTEQHLPIFGGSKRQCPCGQRSDWTCAHQDCNTAFCIIKERNCYYKYHTDGSNTATTPRKRLRSQ